MKSLLSKALKWVVSVLMVLVMCPTMITSVNAEDASLNDFMDQDISITGVNHDWDGGYSVRAGQEYEINMHFAETKTKQFTDTMTYTFPAGFNVADGVAGEIAINVEDGGTTYTISKNSYTVSGNVLTFKFNTKDANWSHLAAANNAEFGLQIKGTFSGDTREITWGGNYKYNFKIDNTHNVAISKWGSYNSTTKCADFTIRLNSTGDNTGVVVNDVISGTALTLISSTIGPDKSKASDISAKGFTYNVGSMSNGQQLDITYSCSVDFADLFAVKDGKTSYTGTWDETGNTASVTWTGTTQPNRATASLNNIIGYTSLSKTRTSDAVDSATQSGHKTISWQVVYNQERLVSMAGAKIIDSVAQNSFAMTYVGQAKIDVYKAGETTPFTTRYTNISGSSFEYDIPTTDNGAYEYIITYNTDVDMNGYTSWQYVKNEVNDNHGQSSSAEGWAGPVEGTESDASKTATKVTKDTVDWKITLTVPESGLTTAKVLDYLPNKSIDGNWVYEGLDGEPSVEGTTGTESWDWEYVKDDQGNENKSQVLFTFYKNTAKTVTGLNGGVDDKGNATSKTITITLKTKNDSTWLNKAVSDANYSEHINTICFTANKSNIWRTASAFPPVYTLSKSAADGNNYSGTTKATDGTTVPFYNFTIDFTGFSSDETTTIDDVFPTSLFVIPGSTAKLEFWDYNWGYKGATTANVKQTATGAEFSFDNSIVPAGSARARISYSLQVKGATSLATLIATAAQSNDTTYVLSNKATYHDLSATATSKYTYTSVTKQVVAEKSNLNPTDGTQAYAHYQIVVNPDGQDMSPDGNVVIVKDTFCDALSIDYSSIVVPDGVTYDVSGNVATFKVPDNTPITIEYNAKVISSEVSTNISNTVEVNGFRATTSNTATGSTQGQGTAKVYSVNVMKYEAGNMGNLIGGVTFALYYQDNTPVVDKNGNQVTVTTSNDKNSKDYGTVILKGDQDKYGWTLNKEDTYYLVETNTPAGYKQDTTHYNFKVGNKTDYTNPALPVFASGETLKVRNMPLVDTKVVKTWNDGDDQDGLRLKSLPVTLTGTVTTADSATPKTVYSQSFDLTASTDASKNWTAEVTGLDGCDENNNKITYEWSEATVEGYESSSAITTIDDANTASGKEDVTTFTNTYTPTTKDVEVYKTWEDANNQDGVRPESVTYQLYKSVDGSDPVLVDGKTITLTGDSKADTWTAKFEKLPVNENGKTITYSVKETNIDPNYTVDTEKTTALNVANKHTPSVKNVTVNKVWDDEGNKEGFRPDSVVFQLQKTVNGVTSDVDGKKYTLTAKNVDATDSNKWSYTFENLPEKENGQTITYSVRETNTDTDTDTDTHYTADSDNSDLTVTNSRTVDMTATASGTKTWNDTNNEGARPTSITVYLHANGSTDAVQTKTVSADAQGNWTYTFTGLQKYANGKEIKYSVTEDAPANYTAAADGMNLTNTYAPGETSVTVTKNWDDQADAYGTRPESIKVQLYADDVKQGDEVELNANSATPWTYTWSKLNKTQNGKEIAYTVKEVNVPNGYDNTTVVATKDNGYTLINTRNTANLVIKKTFAGDTITEDDQKNLNFEVTGQNNYDKTFNYGKDFKDGILTIPNLAVGDYTVKEVNSAIKGYNVTVKYTVNGTDSTEFGKATLKKNGSSEVDITDSYAKKGSLVIHKTFAGDDVTKEDLTNLTFEITKPDKTTETIHLANFIKNADGTYTYTMPQADDGEYTVHESNAEIEGYDVTVTTTVKGEEKETTSVASNQNGVVEIKDSYAKWGNLAIKKTFAGDTITEDDKKNLNFEVKGPNGYDKTFNYGNDFTDGVLTLKNVKPGEYTVEEKNAEIDGYDLKTTVTVNGNETNKITSKPDTDSMIEITNDYSAWGNFVIHKTFDGDDVTKEDLTNLQFEITKPDGTTEVKHLSDFTKNADGTYTYTVTRAAKGEYTVRETNPEIKGYDVTVTTTVNGDDTNKTTVATMQDGVVEIKDSYATLGNLVIHKTFDGDNITDEDKANLKFDITSPDGKTTTVGLDQFTKNDDGTYTYTIEKVADGKYTVEETNPEIKGYDVTVTTTVNGDQGNTTEVKPHQNGVVEIKDSYALKGNLVIKKTFDGDNITDEDKANLKFDITSPDGKTTTVGLDQFTKNDDGTYTYTIEQAEDGKYTVEETNAEIKGYDVTVTTTVNGEKGNTTEVAPHQDGEVDIKNSYTHNIANLVIKKSFDGDNVTEEDKANLKFEITYPDGTTKTVAYSEFKNGEYTLTDVPTGKYSVREVNPEIAGYNVTVTTTVEGKEGNSTTLVPHATSEIDIKDTYTTPETPKTPSTPTPTPETPSTPETPTTPKTPDRPATPNTGDQTNAPLAAGVMGFAMLAAGFAIFFKKKYSD